jgi:hypothetical protein
MLIGGILLIVLAIVALFIGRSQAARAVASQPLPSGLMGLVGSVLRSGAGSGTLGFEYEEWVIRERGAEIAQVSTAVLLVAGIALVIASLVS